MEVSKFSEQGIKIRSKIATLGIDPVGGKGALDGVLFLDRRTATEKLTVDGDPIIISGPGEYEIKSIKFNGFEKEDTFCYIGRVDNVKICVLYGNSLPKIKELLEECDMCILHTNGPLDAKAVVDLNAKVVILYGSQALDGAKTLGKDALTTVTKYTMTREKLPSEMEVVVLG